LPVISYACEIKKDSNLRMSNGQKAIPQLLLHSCLVSVFQWSSVQSVSSRSVNSSIMEGSSLPNTVLCRFFAAEAKDEELLRADVSISIDDAAEGACAL